MAKRERENDKERKKKRKRRYGQVKLKHAKRGVLSCVVSGVVGILLIVLLTVAYASNGTAGALIGGAGISSLILSGIGLYTACRGFREREKNYLTCKIGASICLFYIIIFIGFFCRGLF